ncbi:MAG: hypothetical protein JSS82_04815 [Bacteroidetes bacterium]|nr:hypothetical protein [Bacteroidota bacterium]
MQTVYAQANHAADDTIRLKGERLALLKRTHIVPPTYSIVSFAGTPLIDIYPGKVQIKGRQYYIITFNTGGKRAIFGETKNVIADLVQQLLRSGVLIPGGIDSAAAAKFIKAHPIPKGYPDAEQLNEFGKL